MAAVQSINQYLIRISPHNEHLHTNIKDTYDIEHSVNENEKGKSFSHTLGETFFLYGGYGNGS